MKHVLILMLCLTNYNTQLRQLGSMQRRGIHWEAIWWTYFSQENSPCQIARYREFKIQSQRLRELETKKDMGRQLRLAVSRSCYHPYDCRNQELGYVPGPRITTEATARAETIKNCSSHCQRCCSLHRVGRNAVALTRLLALIAHQSHMWWEK